MRKLDHYVMPTLYHKKDVNYLNANKLEEFVKHIYI